jgi:hypothetical protein
MKKICFIILAITFLSLTTVFAQANKLETAKRVEQTDKLVKPIEVYVKTIEDLVEREEKPHLVIADVSDYNKDENPVWKQYASEAEFEKARETEEAYTIAYIWKKDGKIVQVNFTYSSPSGDWVEYYFQTYRADGSLAKVDRELRTFMGDIIVNRIQIYDETGKLLKETKNYRNLDTQKMIAPTDNYEDVEVGQAYLQVNKLPFADMLNKKTK